MKSGDKHIIYTAQDIEQYLAGGLSPLQMHAMEKAALDDPLLSEAMEGYAVMKDKSWKNDLVALRMQLAQKTETAKIIPLHKPKNNWWKTAAAIFIVGSGITVTYVLTRNKAEDKPNQQIAQTVTQNNTDLSKTEPETPVSTIQSLNPSASSAKEELLVNNNQATTNRNESESKVAPMSTVAETNGTTDLEDLASVSASKDTAVSTPSPAKTEAPGAGNTATAGEVVTNKAKAAEMEAVASRSQKKLPNANDKKEATLNNYFTAQVLAPDNTPLPFTNISIKKENFGTYADAQGMVRLVSTDSMLLIDIKSVGYLPRTYALRNNQAQTKIILQEDVVALQDRVVIGNANVSKNQQSRRARLVTDSAVNIEPADGWENYNTYVANNLYIPESSIKKDFHGEVELSFDVKPNGTISNLRVSKSSGAEYDEAAKRLIMEGPQWKIKKGKKTSASVKLQF
ncbi:MAG: TonB family protein [Ferruginibacter sp.]